MKISGDITAFMEDHVDECALLLVSVFNSKPWNEHRNIETVKKELSWALNAPQFIGFVYSADEILGFVIGSYEADGPSKTFHLIDFCVSADARGKGIGGKLLQHLERALKETNTHSIYLTTRKGSLAQSFYERNGFRVASGDIAMWPNIRMIREL